MNELNLPILYVSHSADEVARFADHLLVLEQGRVLANGPLVATLSRIDFPLALGEDSGVVLDGKVVERDEAWHLMRVAFAGGELWLKDSGHTMGQLVRLRLLARDVSISHSPHEDTSILNRLACQVDLLQDDIHPGLTLLRLKLSGSMLLARVTKRSVAHMGLQPGHSVWAQIKSAAII